MDKQSRYEPLATADWYDGLVVVQRETHALGGGIVQFVTFFDSAWAQQEPHGTVSFVLNAEADSWDFRSVNLPERE